MNNNNNNSEWGALLSDIKEKIKSKGISNYALAKSTGIDRSNIVRLFRGSTPPNIETLVKICNAAGLAITITEKTP